MFDDIETFELLVCQFIPRMYTDRSGPIPKLKEDHKELVYEFWVDGFSASDTASEIVNLETEKSFSGEVV